MPGKKMDRQRIRRSVAFVLLAIAALLIVGRTAAPWLSAVDQKTLRIKGLEYALKAYPVILNAVAGLAILVIVLGLSSRRFPSIRHLFVRLIFLALVLVVSLLICEGFAKITLAWQHRMPRMPRGLRAHESARPGTKDDVSLLVVGESSAEGVPYRDWLSVGKIVTWQLRTLIPDRMFHVEVQARAGWTLEQMHQRLAEIKKAPDALIVYAGHNEFASRYGWFQEVTYYDDDRRGSLLATSKEWVSGFSGLWRLIDESYQRELVAMRPPPSNRRLVDAPSCSPLQAKQRLIDFRQRLESIAAFCKESGILAVFVIPPGNDAGFEPNRSILPPDTSSLAREEFARKVTKARQREAVDPIDVSIERYRSLIAHQPGFAETHFRLARFLERKGDKAEAYQFYVRARDLDGHPMRCPSAFQDVYREVAKRWDAILIDGQAVLRSRNPDGQLDDRLFNDAFHPSFEGQLALAEAILAGLKQRNAFGWPDEVQSPSITPDECARHFDLTRAAWKSAADFAAGFYGITMPIRFDSAERSLKKKHYSEVVRALAESRDADSLGCPGIGVKPVQDRLKP